jgi:uncharacterized protein
MSKIELTVMGLSASESSPNTYALILSDEKSKKRIPIIIGSAEAQAIAIELEKLRPPRPLTHDLFKNVAITFEINLSEVNIYKLEEGVFFSNLVLENGTKKVAIDSRTSDAIALALRFGCPIFTTPEIIEKAGVVIKFESKKEKEKEMQEDDVEFDPVEEEEHENPSQLQSKTIAELEAMLKDSVNNEEYELASRIKEELSKRKY